MTSAFVALRLALSWTATPMSCDAAPRSGRSRTPRCCRAIWRPCFLVVFSTRYGAPHFGHALGDRTVPQHEVAVGIVRAAEEHLARARLALDDLAALVGVLRTLDAGRLVLDVLALGILRARGELAEAPLLDRPDWRRSAGTSRRGSDPAWRPCRPPCLVAISFLVVLHSG